MSKHLQAYSGLKANLLTQHGKELAICQELLNTNGSEVIHETRWRRNRPGQRILDPAGILI